MRILCWMISAARLFLFLLFFLGCSLKEKTYTFVGATMGTSYSVKISSEDIVNEYVVKKEVDKILESFNRIASTYIKDSEISQFNSSRAGQWIKVSPIFWENVEVARQVYELSRGLYDPSVSPLVERWSFGIKESSLDLKSEQWKFPDDREVAALTHCVGLSKFKFRFSEKMIQKTQDCQRLDFSSLAKGQGVDQVATSLEKLGYENFMVEIGGEIRVKGLKAGKKWRVGIESSHQKNQVARVLELESGECIATSGDYRNFFIHEGKKYSHTINPLTGYPLDHQQKVRTVSTTVIASSCIKADAWATAMMMLKKEDALALAREQKIWVRLVQKISGKWVVSHSGPR